MNKAPVLSEEQVAQIETPCVGCKRIKDTLALDCVQCIFEHSLEAQLNADHEYYQGIIRGIFEEIEDNAIVSRDEGTGILCVDWSYYQSLKSKYMSWSAQNVNISL